jgi:DNA-binding NtrC family response regulator
MVYDGVILCVDDERMILDSLKSQLHRAFGNKYLLEIAESSDEALEILEELLEDNVSSLVIISDWLMPGMKGDEFLIKAHELFPHVFKIMLTGQADSDAIAKAKTEVENFKLIYKPWNVDELVNTITKGMQA